MNSIYFQIPGDPYGKGRPRITTRGGYARNYTPEKTTDYENHVAACFIQARNKSKFKKIEAGKPVEILIKAFFKIPKNTSKKKRKKMSDCKMLPTKKPDADNIAKIILDALNGLAYNDDNQIVHLIVKKFYFDGEPVVEIGLKEFQRWQPEL